jgi:acetyltransferase-like isoleucine patch superfamily enzyme
MGKRALVMPGLAELVSGHAGDRLVGRVGEVISALETRGRVAKLRRLVRSGQFTVGAHTYGLPTVFISHPGDRVSIGRYCSIAPGVVFVPGGMHPLGTVSTFPFRLRWNLEDVDSAVGRHGPIVVEDDVWLCTGSTVLSGVRVGTGGVVAAGAVVVEDVEPYQVVGGIPARPIGERFDRRTAAALVESRWWEWPESEVQRVLPLMERDRIKEFLTYVASRSASVA